MGPGRPNERSRSVPVRGLRRKEREGAKEAATVAGITAVAAALRVPEAKSRRGASEAETERKTGQAPRLPARQRERIAFPVPAAPRELSRLPPTGSARQGGIFPRRASVWGPIQPRTRSGRAAPREGGVQSRGSGRHPGGTVPPPTDRAAAATPSASAFRGPWGERSPRASMARY